MDILFKSLPLGDDQTTYGECLEINGISSIDKIFNAQIQEFYRQEPEYTARLRMLKQIENHLHYIVKKNAL